MIHYFLGGDSVSGGKHSRYLIPDGNRAVFVIYCRRCHMGLCKNIEIGTVEFDRDGRKKFRNVIFVEPHECGEAIPYPEQYQEAARYPDAV